VRASPTPKQRVERIGAGTQEDVGQADRQACAKRLAIATTIFGGDPSRLARDAHRDRPTFAFQRPQPLLRDAAGCCLVHGEVAEADQQVVRLVGVAWESLWQQALQLELDRGDRLRVEKLTQVLAAEQLGQQLAIECERLRSALGQRRVALVHELSDVGEQQRRRERRSALGVDSDNAETPSTRCTSTRHGFAPQRAAA